MNKHVDYIIVGFGLAGLAFAEQLRLNAKRFVVISQLNKSSSKVAGGMYNPVILKRFTLAWNADSQLKTAIPFYQKIEAHLKESFLVPLPIYRIFNNIEEQNNWHIAADKPTLSPFLSSKFIDNNNPHIQANHKFGNVEQSGRLKVGQLINCYLKTLLNKQQFIEEAFDYNALIQNTSTITYKNYTAKNIVFCEGFGMKDNPFFNYLPMKPSKGETITILAENLNLEVVVKSGVFILPTGTKNQYLVGATYNWTDETWDATTNGKEELIKKLNKFITCPYTVIQQLAGIRPTVKDRRPLLGQHPTHKNLYVLNGLGTRGVMAAPTASKQLYEFIENKKSLPSEVDIKRYSNQE